ncbi:apolipo protein O-domain-containing protein [Scheffersomyces xylosifermentans]|uniref:apolipo protein O-domain-containing protein n=1 Tax=Scheffersomyces xylosifermentans TaxID=1304137 RepID=UPI00315CA87E
MFSRQIARIGMPFLGAGAVVVGVQSPVRNEPKRRFYEDEVDVVPVPGTVTPAAGTELEALGPNRLIDGISVRSPSSVESLFKSIREFTFGAYTSLQQSLDKGYNKYHETERQVATTVGDLHYKAEDLLPNSIYIVIATLSGNIAARQRGLLAKATFPVVLGLASFKYFLPQTFSNTTSFIWKLEKTKLPQLAQQQENVYNKTGELVQKIEETSESSRKSIESGVQSLRKSIADVTGLNVDEDVSKK